MVGDKSVLCVRALCHGTHTHTKKRSIGPLLLTIFLVLRDVLADALRSINNAEKKTDKRQVRSSSVASRVAVRFLSDDEAWLRW